MQKGEGKCGFIEANVAQGENTMSHRIIASIAAVIRRVAQEHARDRTTI
jgi:hypothetical protein